MLKLEGGCYCKAVTFSALSHTPYPYMRCYCSFCRTTSGSGGYGINIMAEADTLSVIGEKSLARILHENAEFWGDFSESICSIGRKA